MAESSELSGSTIALEHSYRVAEAVHRGALATLYAASWLPFETPVWIRWYENLAKLRLLYGDTVRVRRAVMDHGGLLRHDLLPDVIDIGEEDATRPFVVMRLPPGQLLLHRLRDGKPLAPSAVATLVDDVACALDACRAGGLPHRGPTPDRIWFSAEGHATLLGAGEVLFRDETVAMQGVAATELLWHIPPEAFQKLPSGASRGGPSGGFPAASSSHASTEPEANDTADTGEQRARSAARASENDPRAEVYALACLAYHCLSGRHPYFSRPADPADGILASLRGAKPELPEHPDSSPLGALLHAGLSLDPADRPATPREFAAALRSIAAPAPAQSPAHPAPLATRSSPASWLWSVSSLVLFATLLFVLLWKRSDDVTLVITSDPSGLELAEVVGHVSEPRGPTPLILTGRSALAPVELRAVGPDGALGPPASYDPALFQELGHCRRMDVRLRFPE